MILVGQYDSPYVRRVAVSLHMLGLPFSRNPISVFGDAEAMRRINPLGRVPSLVLEDGEVIVDSGAILDHLDQLAGPERALMPPSGIERRRAQFISALATGAADKAVTLVYERVLRPADKYWPAYDERCLTQLSASLAALEAECGTHWFLARGPLQPDITTACMLGYLKLRLADSLPAGRYPGLERLYGTCMAHEAFRLTEPKPNESLPSGH
jgi:glutathione S-transferase